VNWSEYRDKLLPIVEQTEIKNNHRAAKQIDLALLKKRAFLFLVPNGFFVLRPIIEKGEIYNEVLFAYSFATGNTIKHQATIATLTRQIGGKGVIVYTVLKTLIKLLKRLGYQQQSVDGRIVKLIKVVIPESSGIS